MSINQTFKLSLTAICTVLLVACGGSGGNGGGDNSNTATPINNEAPPTNTNTNTNTNNQNTTQNSTGQIAKIGVDDAGITISDLNSSDFTSITVDGKTIQVVLPGIYAGGWSNITEGKITTNICCGKYDSAKIGFYDLGEDEAAYLFYDGKVTDKNQIPQSGQFSYKGDSLIFPGSTDDTLPDEIKGSANLTADFNNKTLTGNLSGTGVSITVNANINQNEFSGSATSSVDPGRAAVQGKFYGDNAKQLAGMAISNDTEWGAGFIAAKQ